MNKQHELERTLIFIELGTAWIPPSPPWVDGDDDAIHCHQNESVNTTDPHNAALKCRMFMCSTNMGCCVVRMSAASARVRYVCLSEEKIDLNHWLRFSDVIFVFFNAGKSVTVKCEFKKSAHCSSSGYSIQSKSFQRQQRLKLCFFLFHSFGTGTHTHSTHAPPDEWMRIRFMFPLLVFYEQIVSKVFDEVGAAGYAFYASNPHTSHFLFRIKIFQKIFSATKPGKLWIFKMPELSNPQLFSPPFNLDPAFTFRFFHFMILFCVARATCERSRSQLDCSLRMPYGVLSY